MASRAKQGRQRQGRVTTVEEEERIMILDRLIASPGLRETPDWKKEGTSNEERRNL